MKVSGMEVRGMEAVRSTEDR
ncbi:hypothetical protein A2U01_0114671, partial [Trifolium medium]|nr:hypothetical protein [Trifolium medium]